MQQPCRRFKPKTMLSFAESQNPRDQGGLSLSSAKMPKCQNAKVPRRRITVAGLADCRAQIYCIVAAKIVVAHSFLELGVRAIRVVDELLVQSKGFLVHEPLTAAVALDRGINFNP